MSLSSIIKPMLFLFAAFTTSICSADEVTAASPIQVSLENHDVLVAPSEYQIQISSDNKRVIYAARNNVGGILHLFSASIDGGNVIQLTPSAVGTVFQFKISPDSKWIVYRGLNGANIVPILGGPSIRIDASYPINSFHSFNVITFSPDGQHIVYSSLDALVSIKIDGTNATRLNTNQPAGTGGLGAFFLSPDGSKVVYTSARLSDFSSLLFSVSIGQTTLTELITDTSDIEGIFTAQFSRDGNRIIFGASTRVESYQRLYSIPASGGAPLPLSPVATDDGGASSFKISHGGTHIVYTFRDSLSSSNLNLMSANIVSGAMNTLSTAPDGFGYLKTSTNTDTILFSIINDAQDTQKFYATPITGGATTGLIGGIAIPDNLTGLSIIPDESTLVWSTTQTVESSLQHEIRSALLGGSEVTLVNRTTDNRQPFHRPNGFRVQGNSSRVAFFNSDREHTSHGPFIAPIAGGEVQRVDSSELLYEEYTLSHDGQYLVYSASANQSGGPYRIYSSKLATIVEIEAQEDSFCFAVKIASGIVFPICF